MNVLGLDISSSTIGWAIVNKEMALISSGYIKPMDSRYPIEERLDSIVNPIKKICNDYEPGIVVIEEIAKGFTRGKSNIDTIMILGAFNRFVGYVIYKATGNIPIRIMPSSIRRTIAKFLKIKGSLTKEGIHCKVKEFFDFEPELIKKGRSKGREKKENLDVTDAIAMSWGWVINNRK